jgi:hypothetical protein
MASEKQVAFINKLIERKGMHQSMPIINRIVCHETLETINSGRASVIINLLLELDDFNEVAYHRAMQAGLNRYEQLVLWAKDNGVKGVRSRMKTANIMKLIADAGLTAPAELVRA